MGIPVRREEYNRVRDIDHHYLVETVWKTTSCTVSTRSSPRRRGRPGRWLGWKKVRRMKEYLSLRELAIYASLSVKTLRSYLAHPRHPLPHYQLPGKILVRREDFDAWLEHFRTGEVGPDVDLEKIVNDIVSGL
jgi:hypothetical protein